MTGAGGYVGTHVVATLISLGHDVIPIVRSASLRSSSTPLNEFVADVLSEEFSIDQIPGGLPEALIHLAWQNGFVHDSTSHITMLSDHVKFLLKSAELGVKKLTVLGSVHEIGFWEGEVNADTLCNPLSLYGLAKDTLRKTLFKATPESCSLRWARAFYITGDDARNSSVFARVLQLANAGEKVMPFTQGENEYDFIDIDELAVQIAALATCELSSTKIIVNCCSGYPQTIGSKVEEFITKNDLDIRLVYGAYPSRPYDSPRIWGETATINEILKRSV